MDVLIFGCNYSGSWKTYQSENDAKKMAKFLQKHCKVNTLRLFLGRKCTYQNILKHLKNFVCLQNNVCKKLIYFAGHGCQSRDTNGDEADGMDENWQTFDRRRITDDVITKIIKTMEPKPKETIYTIISDSCHSRTIVDVDSFGENAQIICIGAAQDYQSALQTGDGSVLTFFLLQVLQENLDKSFAEISKLLKRAISKSFVGGLQKCDIVFSQDRLKNLSFFCSDK